MSFFVYICKLIKVLQNGCSYRPAGRMSCREPAPLQAGCQGWHVFLLSPDRLTSVWCHDYVVQMAGHDKWAGFYMMELSMWQCKDREFTCHGAVI